MKKIISLLALILVVTSAHIVTADSQELQIPTSFKIRYDKTTTSEELQNLVRNKIESVNSKSINLIVKGESRNIKTKDLGIHINPKEEITTYANEQESSFTNIFSKVKTQVVNLDLHINKSKLIEAISNEFKDITPAQEPYFEYINNEFILVKGKSGHDFNVNSLGDDINNHFLENGDLPTDLSISIYEVYPSISDQESNQKLTHLNNFEAKEIQFSYPDQNYSQSIIIDKGHIQSVLKEYSLNKAGKDKIKNDVIDAINKNRVDLIIKKLDLENQTLETEGQLQDGIIVHQDMLIQQINNILNNKTTNPNIEIKTSRVKAQIIDNSNSGFDFELLGQGKSNYKASSKYRAHNVEFAADTKYNNILIPAGEKFKFNSHLGGPITISRGWKNAYIIQGGEIVPGVGGGICQMSTTVYRAALNTGLDIDTHYNHSLYIDYYKDYGDGLDSTIFPGGKDLIFTNNTPGPIIMQSFHNQNDDLFVNMIGVSDGRQTTLEGPFYRSDKYENPYELQLRSNQIGWMRTIQNPDGTITEEPIISKYGKYYKR